MTPSASARACSRRARMSSGSDVTMSTACLDEHAERSRVDELDRREVDDEPLRLLGGAGEQRLAHLVGVVEVELACEMHDDAAVAVVDAGDGIDPAPRFALHNADSSIN